MKGVTSLQPGVAEELYTLVCDDKTLQGSIAEIETDAARFIAQVCLYSKTLGVAIAKTNSATDASGEIHALRQVLEAVELEGGLVLADALHANRPFSSTSPGDFQERCYSWAANQAALIQGSSRIGWDSSLGLLRRLWATGA